jgi:pimeloyl-ACP methyl ester carboxylesterase
MTATTATVATDGTDLYVERRGDGPALLMIPGGGGDGGVFSQVADMLADEYTVLTYDRRGNSRSRLHGSPSKLSMQQQSADVVAILDANGIDRASVFGSSGGAIISLDLAARHDDRLDVVVPHEPPLPRLLPDPSPYLEMFDKLDVIAEREGGDEAYNQFVKLHAELHGLPVDAADRRDRIDKSNPEIVARFERLEGNWAFFTETEMRSFIDYLPDLEGLAKSDAQLVLAGGADSRDIHRHYAYEAAKTVAERLGVEFVEFPGGHISYVEVPQDFATALRELLAARRAV